MDKKLKEYLDSLSPAARAIVVEKLGVVETADEKLVNTVRKAAGLPEAVDVDPNEDKTENAARKAAGLK